MLIQFRNIRFTLLSICILLMSACTTMDQSDCEMANWYDVGRQDGERGKKMRAYAQHQKECSAFGLEVDISVYKEGWLSGIEEYCTEDNGYQEGLLEKLGDRLAKDDLSEEKRSALRSRRKGLKKDSDALQVRLVLAKIETKKNGYSVIY